MSEASKYIDTSISTSFHDLETKNITPSGVIGGFGWIFLNSYDIGRIKHFWSLMYL